MLNPPCRGDAQTRQPIVPRIIIHNLWRLVAFDPTVSDSIVARTTTRLSAKGLHPIHFLLVAQDHIEDRYFFWVSPPLKTTSWR